MCGILGNFGYFDRNNFLNQEKYISDQLHRRGPDQQNLFDTDYFISKHSRLILVAGNFFL